MLCKLPFMRGVQAYGCDQCLPCRINRRRIWTHRLLLEQRVTPQTSFATLTYDEKHLPEGGTLVIQHYQEWLKRLRKHLPPRSLRFFIVGEYGDLGQRPHYHAALFGYPPCQWFPGSTKADVFRRRGCKCHRCSLIRNTWQNGEIDLGSLTKDSAQYIAGYITKRMTFADDPRLGGRHPEFSRMSLRGGIGIGAVPVMLDAITSSAGCKAMEKEGDVPRALTHGGKNMPLGRYLRRKLREAYGIKDGKAPPEVIEKYTQEMRGLFKAIKEAPGYKAGYAPSRMRLQEELVNHNRQGIWNTEARFKLYKKKGTL